MPGWETLLAAGGGILTGFVLGVLVGRRGAPAAATPGETSLGFDDTVLDARHRDDAGDA